MLGDTERIRNISTKLRSITPGSLAQEKNINSLNSITKTEPLVIHALSAYNGASGEISLGMISRKEIRSKPRQMFKRMDAGPLTLY